MDFVKYRETGTIPWRKLKRYILADNVIVVQLNTLVVPIKILFSLCYQVWKAWIR